MNIYYFKSYPDEYKWHNLIWLITGYFWRVLPRQKYVWPTSISLKHVQKVAVSPASSRISCLFAFVLFLRDLIFLLVSILRKKMSKFSENCLSTNILYMFRFQAKCCSNKGILVCQWNQKCILSRYCPNTFIENRYLH